MTPRTTLVRRVVSALDASPSRIPVLLGGCGTGRTTLLRLVGERLGRTTAQYVDVERTATTPERFLRAVQAASPFPAGDPVPDGARGAFDAWLAFLTRTRSGSEPATFLLDEFLELRTFENFPGLRRVLHELAEGLAASGNRFVLSSRYVARALRLLRDAPARFEVIHMPALGPEETAEIVAAGGPAAQDGGFVARTVHALSDGRPGYVRALVAELSNARAQGTAGDPLGALAAALSTGGALASACAHSYELRLHRARGYGALKAILDILASDEGLTLTEVSQRLQRTPGSTKDYLSWLEDVDLVTSRQKRYSFSDPLMRVWVRLHCRPVPPGDDDVAREVHRYAMPRLPQAAEAPVAAPEPAYAVAAGPASGIIEID